MNQVTNQHHQTFEGIRQQTDEGRNYWSARDLQLILEYSRWDKFKPVILKAIKACETSGIDASDHFPRVGKMVEIGSGAERYVEDYDYHLSRYACYLIVQNGDPTKHIMRLVQKYAKLLRIWAVRCRRSFQHQKQAPNPLKNSIKSRLAQGVMMNRTLVRSSNIASIGYENGTLEIDVIDGGAYQYFNVSECIYQGMMSATSKGGYFHDHIKDRYQTRKAGW